MAFYAVKHTEHEAKSPELEPSKFAAFKMNQRKHPWIGEESKINLKYKINKTRRARAILGLFY